MKSERMIEVERLAIEHYREVVEIELKKESTLQHAHNAAKDSYYAMMQFFEHIEST